MSLHASFVLIEGDHRRGVERLLAEFGYAFAVVPRTTQSFASASKTLFQWQVSPTVVKKAVGFVRGWTALYDPEQVLAGDPVRLQRLSRLARSRVFAMVCDGASGAYGFTCVRGSVMRALLASGHGVVLDTGTPLPEESDVARDGPGEEDVKRVLERVAFPYSAFSDPGTWQILTLEVTEAAHAAAATAGGDGDPSAGKRRWWRFW